MHVRAMTNCALSVLVGGCNDDYKCVMSVGISIFQSSSLSSLAEEYCVCGSDKSYIDYCCICCGSTGAFDYVSVGGRTGFA